MRTSTLLTSLLQLTLISALPNPVPAEAAITAAPSLEDRALFEPDAPSTKKSCKNLLGPCNALDARDEQPTSIPINIKPPKKLSRASSVIKPTIPHAALEQVTALDKRNAEPTAEAKSRSKRMSVSRPPQGQATALEVRDEQPTSIPINIKPPKKLSRASSVIKPTIPHTADVTDLEIRDEQPTSIPINIKPPKKLSRASSVIKPTIPHAAEAEVTAAPLRERANAPVPQGPSAVQPVKCLLGCKALEVRDEQTASIPINIKPPIVHSRASSVNGPSIPHAAAEVTAAPVLERANAPVPQAPTFVRTAKCLLPPCH